MSEYHPWLCCDTCLWFERSHTSPIPNGQCYYSTNEGKDRQLPFDARCTDWQCAICFGDYSIVTKDCPPYCPYKDEYYCPEHSKIYDHSKCFKEKNK